jgi:hypothetical protein
MHGQEKGAALPWKSGASAPRKQPKINGALAPEASPQRSVILSEAKDLELVSQIGFG